MPPVSIVRDIVYAVGAAASSPFWGAALLRTGKWRTDWAGRLGKVGLRGDHASPHPSPLPEGEGAKQRLLFHAVSVGEVNLIRDLIEMLADEHGPALDIVIAVTTNTGYDRAVSLYGDRFAVVRYPLDFTFAVRRFLDAVRPDAVALAELEVWPNFIEECDRRGVPVCVINGRLSDKSIKGYRRLKPVLRGTFAKLARVAAQDPRYAERFVEMGLPEDRVAVLDTMKWDTARVDEPVSGADQLAADLGIDRSRPVIVLGSTGTDEEKPIVNGLRYQLDRTVQIIIVPRKPERFDEVAAMFPNVIRRSECENAKPEPRNPKNATFLLDTMGELRQAYALANAVIVGRSFNGWGGSDPIEPVALGKPTVIGPDTHNFADVVASFVEAGGIAQVDSVTAAVVRIKRWLADPTSAAALAERGRQVILQRQGATRRHAEMLIEVLESEKPQMDADDHG